MRILGIDPGKTGALALACVDGLVLRAMPDTPRERCDLIVAQAPDFVVLERIEPRPTFWRDKETGEEKRSLLKSSALLAEAAGELRGMLVALGLPFEEPRPQRWQQVVGIPKKAGKAGAKRVAQNRWPDCKITQYGADAACLALYGMLVYGRRAPVDLFSPETT